MSTCLMLQIMEYSKKNDIINTMISFFYSKIFAYIAIRIAYIGYISVNLQQDSHLIHFQLQKFPRTQSLPAFLFPSAYLLNYAVC